MVDFNTFMSVALSKCAPSGSGTQSARQDVFQQMVRLWNREEDTIRAMSRTELRQELNCPDLQ